MLREIIAKKIWDNTPIEEAREKLVDICDGFKDASEKDVKMAYVDLCWDLSPKDIETLDALLENLYWLKSFIWEHNEFLTRHSIADYNWGKVVKLTKEINKNLKELEK